jgi:hypothetical protein
MRAAIDVNTIGLSELTVIFQRDDSQPALLVDDLVSTPAGRVVAFRCDLPFQRTTTEPDQDFDIAIIAHDSGEIAESIHRLTRACRVTQSGSRAQCQLKTGKAFRTDNIDLLSDFDVFLNHSDALHGLDTKGLLRVISKTGYDIWIVGGAVRDLIGGLSRPENVNDLDLAGTIPFGMLYAEILKDILEDQEIEVRLTPNGVLHLFVWHQDRRQIWFQYAALKHAKFLVEQKQRKQFWFGGSLEDDVKWRDLTINALFYDPLTGIIFDPTGEGVSDLQFQKLNPIEPIHWSGQFSKALFRTLKFARREQFRYFDKDAAALFLHESIDKCCTDFLGLDLVTKSNIVLAFYGDRFKARSDRGLQQLNLVGEMFDLQRHAAWRSIVTAAADAIHG